MSEKIIGAATKNFIGMEYPIGERGHFCKVGDKCIMHPTERSQTKHAFEVDIVISKQNWVLCTGPDGEQYGGLRDEVCGHVCHPEPGKGNGFVMNDSAFARLEFKS